MHKICHGIINHLKILCKKVIFFHQMPGEVFGWRCLYNWNRLRAVNLVYRSLNKSKKNKTCCCYVESNPFIIFELYSTEIRIRNTENATALIFFPDRKKLCRSKLNYCFHPLEKSRFSILLSVVFIALNNTRGPPNSIEMSATPFDSCA